MLFFNILILIQIKLLISKNIKFNIILNLIDIDFGSRMIKLLHNLCCAFLFIPLFTLADNFMTEKPDYSQAEPIGKFFERENIDFFNVDKVEICRRNELLLYPFPMPTEQICNMAKVEIDYSNSIKDIYLNLSNEEKNKLFEQFYDLHIVEASKVEDQMMLRTYSPDFVVYINDGESYMSLLYFLDREAIFDCYLMIKYKEDVYQVKVSYYEMNQIFLPFLKDNISIIGDRYE